MKILISTILTMALCFATVSDAHADDEEAVQLEESSDNECDGLPIGPILLGGGGLAVFTVGLALGYEADTNYDSYNDRPTEDGADDVENAALAANIGMAVGGAMVAGSLIWWMVDALVDGDEAEVEASTASASTPRLDIAGAADSGAVTLTVDF